MKKTQVAHWLVTTIAIVGGIVLYAREVARDAIAPEGWDFSSFVAHHHHPSSLRRVRLSGLDYYVWLDRTSSDSAMVRMASGPPIYVFDSRGTLIAWSATTGDGEYSVFLGQEWRTGESLTVDQLRAELERNSPPPEPGGSR